jgi:hypothetical protein
LGKEKEPIDPENKSKWENKNDKEHGLIGISISHDLKFHLQGIDDPNESWEIFKLCLVNTQYYSIPLS